MDRNKMSDHATCGCLLALVMEAWTGCRVEIWVEEDGSASVYIHGEMDLVYSVACDTLWLALTAALLAAPTQKGGES